MESRIDTQSDDEDGCIKDKLDKLAEDIKKLPQERLKQLERIITLT